MTEPTRLPQLGTTGKWITDSSGNVVILHGVNLVSKTSDPPEKLGFDERNAAFLAEHGFSVVRLGVVWCNVQPKPPSPPPVVYDDNYLASLARTIELLAQSGIYTLVDFHQDAYAASWGAHGASWGYGAPAWAVVAGGSNEPHRDFPICTFGGDQLNFLDIHKVQTDCDYALDAFWNNRSVSGVPLWDHYLRMQQHVMAFLRGQGGNIFGYDVMNEPTPGSSWVEAYGGKGLDMSHGCPKFDPQKLYPFYEYILPKLRPSHPEAILWFEPNVLHGLGSPTFFPAGFNVPNIGFNFHNYDPGEPDAKPQPIPGYTRPVKNALAYQALTGLPLLTSEFGGAGPSKTTLATIQGIQDGAGLSYIFWAYFNNPTYPIFLDPDPKLQGIVQNMSKPLQFPNVQMEKLMAVTRVYPRTISGTPTSFSFDPNKQTFRFEYKPILPSGQRGTSPTHIVVPSSLYGKSPVYTVTGGTFTQLLGGYDILVRADPTSTTVTVVITP